jgi:hypothetical protein
LKEHEAGNTAKPNTTESQKIKKPRLPKETRDFVEQSFDLGTTNVLDERRKRMLAEYVFNDSLTFEALKLSAGTGKERARELYLQALTRIWKASPPEVQQQFPKEDVLRGKSNRGRKFSDEHKANLSRAQLERQRREWEKKHE